MDPRTPYYKNAPTNTRNYGHFLYKQVARVPRLKQKENLVVWRRRRNIRGRSITEEQGGVRKERGGEGGGGGGGGEGKH